MLEKLIIPPRTLSILAAFIVGLPAVVVFEVSPVEGLYFTSMAAFQMALIGAIAATVCARREFTKNSGKTAPWFITALAGVIVTGPMVIGCGLVALATIHARDGHGVRELPLWIGVALVMWALAQPDE